MASRTAEHTPGDRAQRSQAPSFESIRDHVARQAEQMSVWIHAVDSAAQVHRHMRERAALFYSQAAEKLRETSTPLELLQLQSTLAMQGWQEAWRYGQEMLVAGQQQEGSAAPSRREASSSAQPAASQLPGGALEAARAWAQAWQVLASPLTSALQQRH